MESALAPVFAAVLPVFGLVGCGYLAGRFGLVTQASSLALNQFVYGFALPAMLFVAVYRGSLEEILSGMFLVAIIAATLATAVASFTLSWLCRPRSPPWQPIALAVVLVALQIKVPLPLERFATLLAAAAGPCALLTVSLVMALLAGR